MLDRLPLSELAALLLISLSDEDLELLPSYFLTFTALLE